MNNASIISVVSNLLKEKDYYEASFKECRAIIKQLTEGPGEIEYIHPLDLHDLYNSTTSDCITDGWVFLPSIGKKYKQSVFIPAKSKKFK